MMALQDGSVRIHALNSSDMGALGPCWQMNLHDNNYGSITKLAIGFDEKHIFSTGRDGNFFSFDVVDQQKVEAQMKAAKVSIPSARVSPGSINTTIVNDPLIANANNEEKFIQSFLEILKKFV